LITVLATSFLHPDFAVHDATVCIALVEKDVIAATKAVEGPRGFLRSYSALLKLEGINDGLGKEWIHVATATKPYPGCRYTLTLQLICRRNGEEKEVLRRQKPPSRATTCGQAD